MPYAFYLCVAVVGTGAIGLILAVWFTAWHHRGNIGGRHRADDATWTKFH